MNPPLLIRRLVTLLCLLGVVASQPGVGVALVLALHKESHGHEVFIIPMGDGMQVILDHHLDQPAAAGPVCEDEDDPPHLMHVSTRGERVSPEQTLSSKSHAPGSLAPMVQPCAFWALPTSRRQERRAQATEPRCRACLANCLRSTVIMI